MNWNLVKLSCAGVCALALAASPTLASPAESSGWASQGVSAGQSGLRYGDTQANQALTGLKGPRYGRDGYANAQNGPYRNPYARNYLANRG